MAHTGTLTRGALCAAALSFLALAGCSQNAGKAPAAAASAAAAAPASAPASLPTSSDSNKMNQTITTASGLQYIDTQIGDGAEAKPGHQVLVHYTGWLYQNGEQGTKFDSSLDRGQPFAFGLGQGMVIKGWDEGVAGMKIGGKRTLIIPAELGYGSRGAGGVIPPNATLKFDVELLDLR